MNEQGCRKSSPARHMRVKFWSGEWKLCEKLPDWRHKHLVRRFLKKNISGKVRLHHLKMTVLAYPFAFFFFLSPFAAKSF